MTLEASTAKCDRPSVLGVAVGTSELFKFLFFVKINFYGDTISRELIRQLAQN